MRKYLAYYENEWPANIAELTAVENKPFVGYLKGQGVSFTVIPPPTPETWKIYYTNKNESVVTPSSNSLNVNVVSNTYNNGLGIIVFDGPVTSMESGTFAYCSFNSITIPSTVTSIGSPVFPGCSIASIIVDSGNTTYDSRDNCNAIIHTASNILIQGCKNTIIPNGVTRIGTQAFFELSAPTSITIPNSVESIGNSAFFNCGSLSSVILSNGLKSIEEAAFAGCFSLTSITIPESITSIENSVFSNCTGLTSVTIPNSVTSIGNDAFYGCTGLTSVTIPNSVTSIGNCVFEGCSSLTSVTIGNSVTSIGDWAFNGCSKLTSVTFEGTKDEWRAITKGQYWNYAVPATRVQCSDGQITL